jgi:hypothetical protein
MFVGSVFQTILVLLFNSIISANIYQIQNPILAYNVRLITSSIEIPLVTKVEITKPYILLM